MHKKIKIIIAIFFAVIMIMSSVVLLDYGNSGTFTVHYRNVTGKRYTPGYVEDTTELSHNYTVAGNYRNISPQDGTPNTDNASIYQYYISPL